jgi:hypothetical protein
MPIQPIDLQTLFLQMNQVSKDQAAGKDAAAGAQANQAAEFIKRAEEESTSVVQSDATEEGVERVKDGTKRSTAREKKRGGKDVPDDGTETDSGVEEEVVKDPNLGHHIDISG